MERVAYREQPEITMDYGNLPEGSDSKDREMTPAAAGRKLYKLVGVCIGLLCVLQAVLNISLRLALYSKTDELRKLTDQHFQQGWVYFHSSFYYISSTKKSWQESRDECLHRGADLVIINTKEEQDFTRTFHKLMWIGLSDRAMEGTWTWVDGTPLNKSYWGPGQPNRYKGKNEDCVEISFHDMENSWNDAPCQDQKFWICEKNVAP